jgi:hypothetical protein
MSRAFDIESVIQEATINEKISLLAGTALINHHLHSSRY